MDEELKWYRLTSKKFERQIADAFTLFREQEIEPLLIKGWAAAKYYPPDKPRFFGDVDIAVAAEDHERADTLIKTPALDFIAIDLHKELRDLDTVSWKDIIAHSELIETEFGSIRVPCAEDHLRILCVHWLTDGGAYKNKLWDIYYLIATRSDDFSWERALGTVSKTRQQWIKSTIAIAHKYLGLDVESLPFADEVKTVEPWLTRTLEKEWATDIRLRPMETVIGEPKKIIQQIRKRIPPNPIQATIQMEGRFDARTRVFYQIGNYFQRITPMIRRVSRAIKIRLNGTH